MLAECKKKDRKLQLLIRTPRDLDPAATREKEKAAAQAAANAPKLVPAPKPSEFIATIDMSAGQQMLGIEVDWGDGRTLYVKSVHTGAIEEWNRTHAAEYAVAPGARILAVNGYSDHSETMASLCRELVTAQAMLQLRIRGPPLPPMAPPQEKSDDKDRKDKKEKAKRDKEKR